MDEEKIKKTPRIKTSSLNMEKDTAKLWKLIKTLNETTWLRENDQLYTGKRTASLLY